MEKAPIAIITLNRYIHLRRLIESLKRNPLSIDSELYISVDYPPNERYNEGYKNIVEYLTDGIDGFKYVHVFFQKENLGAYDNITFLKNIIYKKHDTVIFLEDDNEVSPNFLDFCNKGLELFKDDPDILYLNGTNYVWCGKNFDPRNYETQSPTFSVKKRQVMWHAYATWKSTDYLLDYIADNEYISYGKSIRKMYKLYKSSKFFFYSYIRDTLLSNKKKLPWVKGKIYPIDTVINIYMILNDKYLVAPVSTLVRDWGMDGSGLNFKVESSNNMALNSLKLDDRKQFELATQNIEIDSHELELHDKNGLPTLLKRFCYVIGLIIYQIGAIKL